MVFIAAKEQIGDITSDTRHWYDCTSLLSDISEWRSYWFNQINPGMQQAIVGFDEESEKIVPSLLRLVSSSRNVRELFVSAPLLTWMLIVYGIQQKLPEKEMASVCGQQRVEILKKLGFPPWKRLLKLLGKLQNVYIDKDFTQSVKFIIMTEGWECLNHYPSIPFKMATAAFREPRLMKSTLLKYCQNDQAAAFMEGNFNSEMFSSRLFRSYFERSASGIELRRLEEAMGDALRMLSSSDGRRRSKVLSCLDIHELQRIHDELVDEGLGEEDSIDAENDVAFPESPIPGDTNIQPIESYAELLKEAQLQHHCVFSYKSLIMDNHYYVYRMFSPERATIGISIHENGAFEIDQVQLSYNETPSDHTFEAIEAWLNQHRPDRVWTVN